MSPALQHVGTNTSVHPAASSPQSTTGLPRGQPTEPIAERARVFMTKNVFTGLSGFSFVDWMRLLWRHRFRVAIRYLPRVVFITMTSLVMSLGRVLERWRFSEVIDTTRVHPPIFVLGHWRSGTTHLHNLLAQDDRFTYPSFAKATRPHCFLHDGDRVENCPVMGSLGPKTRMIDNMAAPLSAPMEDEVALAAMTGMSRIIGLVFPQSARLYDRFLTMRDTTVEERRRWKEALRTFVTKLSVGHDGPVVLKSPNHTARIRLILEEFPDARFVHVHRHPFTVYRSYLRASHIISRLFRVQVGPEEGLHERIVDQYEELHEAYFEDRALIPEGRLVEMRYEDLEHDPVGQLRHVYEALDLADFGEVKGTLERYVKSLSSYRKSELPDLSPAVASELEQRWHRCFAEWSYSRSSAR